MHEAKEIKIRLAAHFIQIGLVSLNVHKIRAIKIRTHPKDYSYPKQRGLSDVIITYAEGGYDVWQFGNEPTKDDVLIARYKEEAKKLQNRIMDTLEFLTPYAYSLDGQPIPEDSQQ